MACTPGIKLSPPRRGGGRFSGAPLVAAAGTSAGLEQPKILAFLGASLSRRRSFCGVVDSSLAALPLQSSVAQPNSILVTGGAGYIGSHTVKLLISQGYDVTVVDNLSRGYRRNVDPQRLRTVDVTDTESLCHVFAERPFDAVIHFAASIAVGESMRVPELYFQNNVGGSLSLLTAMIRA